jgi:acyl-CoA synthetase (AMP-forming)/AMP-acid ligase II
VADAADPHEARGLKFSTLKRTVIGGSACPPAMIHAFREDYGVEVLHAWGMTEMSPLGTLCTLKNKHLTLPEAEKMKIRLKQGRAIYGVDMKIVDDPTARNCPGTARSSATCTSRGRGSCASTSRARAATRWSAAGSPPATSAP